MFATSKYTLVYVCFSLTFLVYPFLLLISTFLTFEAVYIFREPLGYVLFFDS